MQRFLSRLVILLFIPVMGLSQIRENDIVLINNSSFNLPDQVMKPEFTKAEGSWIRRYNPVTLGFSTLLYVYQNLISVQISSKCSYEISCSNFSKQCITKYGVIKGVALSADRLTRCNRLAAMDISLHDVLDNYKIKDDPENYHLH